MTFCDYHTGMFKNEDRRDDEPIWFSHASEMEIVSFHEAGHAVVGYALGLGCARISVMATIVEAGKVAYHGQSDQSKSAAQRADIRMKAGSYCNELLAQGIFAAAGAAAERKHCLDVGKPIRILLGTTGQRGDHAAINNIAKRLEYMGRSRDAFRRLVWRRAQLAMENDNIWHAVESLAAWLGELWTEMEIGDDTAPGTQARVMPGATARAIMRSVGVRPGLLLGERRSRLLDRPSG